VWLPIIQLCDRRVACRYRLELPTRFSSYHQGVACTGSGRTVELSRHAVLFQAGDLPNCGDSIDLEIEWPVRLQKICPLVLLVQGMIVRTDPRGAVLLIEDYLLRATEPYWFDSAIDRGVTWNLIG
jgi:hypothetical protein